MDGDADLDNSQVLCVACHRGYTRDLAPVVAKNNRMRNKHLGITRRKRTIPGRKFDGTPIYPRWK